MISAIIGVDPGAEGCIFFMNVAAYPVQIQTVRLKRFLPDWFKVREEIASIILEHEFLNDGRILAFIENVKAMPRDKNKLVSFQKLMVNRGKLEGLLLPLVGSRLIPVEQQNWQRAYSVYGLAAHFRRQGLSFSQAETRSDQVCKARARYIFEDDSITKDQADAMLIGLYGYSREIGYEVDMESGTRLLLPVGWKKRLRGGR